MHGSGVVVGSSATSEPAAPVAVRVLGTHPHAPAYRLRIDVLGPLAVCRGDSTVTCSELRRQRVRELLCYLIVHQRVRREMVAEQLWPDLGDSGRNLRVTLTYLQRALQPDRRSGEPPFFVRGDGQWLVLAGHDHLEVDAWQLDDHLDRAGAAERAGDFAQALSAYKLALPLWRGEAYADVSFASWALVERARLTCRYVAAAVRAGELFVAAGELIEARVAAERAIAAEPFDERAYRMLACIHLDAGDRVTARRVLDRCQLALADLGVGPEAATLELLRATG